MSNGTCVAFILFYVFRHYKRIGATAKKRDLISDLEKCFVLLNKMEENNPADISVQDVQALIMRINDFGASMKLQYPLRYVDIYDCDIIRLMINLTTEIINFVKRPFYKRFSGEIFSRFLVLHNLPRALLYDSSGDLSTPKRFHISKQEALDCFTQNILC